MAWQVVFTDKMAQRPFTVNGTFATSALSSYGDGFNQAKYGIVTVGGSGLDLIGGGHNWDIKLTTGLRDSNEANFYQEWQCRLSVSSAWATSGNYEGPNPVKIGWSQFPAAPWALSCSGTWSFSCTLQLVAEISEFFDDVSGMPVYGDMVNPDPPIKRQLRFYYVIPANTSVTLSASITADNGTGTSGTLTFKPTSDLFFTPDVQMSGIACVNSDTHPARGVTCIAQGAFDPAGIAYTPLTYSQTVTNPAGNNSPAQGSIAAAGTGLTLTAKTLADPTYDSYARIEGQATYWPIRSYNLTGVIYAYSALYPGSVSINVAGASPRLAQPVPVSSGIFTVADAQYRGSSTGTCHFLPQGLADYNFPNPVSIDEFAPLALSMNPASLTAAGEDPADSRLMFRGWSWSGIAFGRSANWIVDLCSALTVVGGNYPGAWSSAGGSLSVTGTPAIRLSTTAGSSSATRAFGNPFTRWLGASLAGYRYLRLYVAADINGLSIPSISVTAPDGTKVYTQDYLGAPLLANIAPGYIILDLCSPNGIFETDSQDSRFPTFGWQDGGGNRRYSFPASKCWGVENITSLSINVAGAGHWLDIFSIAQVMLDHNNLSIQPEWKALASISSDQVGGDGAPTLQRRLLEGDTDGRRSLEWFDFARSTDQFGKPIYYIRSLQDLADAVQGVGSQYPYDGWSATVGGYGILPGFLGPQREACMLHGGGLLYSLSGIVQSWSAGIDIPVSFTTAIAQLLFDQIDWMPPIGDLFQHAPPAGPNVALELRAGKILRGSGIGLVYQQSGLPAGGTVVTATDTTSNVGAGTGITDARGEYRTGAPFARHGHSVRVAVPNGVQFARPWNNRKRWRSCLRSAPTFYMNCLEHDSARGWLHVGEGAHVRTFDTRFQLAFLGADLPNLSLVTRLRSEPRYGLLCVLGYQGASAPFTYRLMISDDGGQTAQETTNMTANTACIERDSERGTLVLMWENGGNVQRQQSQDGGNTWSAAAQSLADGNPFAGSILDMSQDPRTGGMTLILQVSVGVTKVLYSDDLGETWATVIS